MSEFNYGVSTTPVNGGEFMEGFFHFLKSAVKQAVDEVLQNKAYENVVLDQNLTTEQLCERWHISRNTLKNWVDNEVITPIKIGGRKNVYSLKDVRELEATGNIKYVA